MSVDASLSRTTMAIFCAMLLWTSTAVCRSRSWQEDVAHRLEKQDYVTMAPLIGVLTQPHQHKHHKESQTISGPLVSWMESAGGRVVPIRYNAPWEEIKAGFDAINGLILPGGSGDLWYGHPFFDTAAYLLQLAKAANDAGDVFPVFGVCLGFETMHILLANRTREELLVPSEGQESVANTIELTRDAPDSLFFRGWKSSLLEEVGNAQHTPTFNAHEWAVPPSAYDRFHELDDELTILSTSKDSSGALFVSTVEGRRYPWLATQWHPEKPPYEFADGTIPHSRTAIETAAETAGLFVDIARLNAHSISYKNQLKLVINNFKRHWVAGEGPSDEDDPLPDTLWFIPEPRRARKDPEWPAGPEKVAFLSRKGGSSDGNLVSA